MFSSGLLVMVLAGVVTAICVYWWLQIDVTPLEVKDLKFLFDMDSLTPTQSWEAWTKEFRDFELVRVTPPHEFNRALAYRYSIGSIIGGAITVIGLLTMIAGLVWTGRPPANRLSR